ncbi:sensor histidine kinase [Thiohalobacter thiocyanaticus]|uniref:histidine kinase n=1 Tax=Thiohalobacter thiocyanaticus TaxID=585455 RepID=A0A426QMD5_9GAMM|nr:PAS domain S-box protein [Thiohalobacter thiocyanaticus]RRQ22923.1 PAS domain S-box protein [Thiohalobacter thiocyanaticus]
MSDFPASTAVAENRLDTSTGIATRSLGLLPRFVLLWLLLSLIVAGVLWLLYWVQLKHLQSLSLIEESQAVELAVQSIRAELAQAGADLVLLSRQSVLKQWLHSPTPHNHERITSDYVAFLKSSGRYDNVRFIDAWGQEFVRVNWIDGQPTVVGEDALQDKSNRYYIKESLELGPGEIYISPFDLNLERGEIVKPMKPVIRFATSIHDEADVKRGVLVLNYNGRRLIERIREIASQTSSHLWLLNEQGYWLFGARSEQEWGFMFDDREQLHFKADYPQIWRAIMDSSSRGTLNTDDGLFTYAVLSPTGLMHEYEGIDFKAGERWVVVSHAPSEILANRMQGPVYSLVVAFFLLSLFTAIVAWAITYYVHKRRQAESALLSSESAWRGLVESAPDAIVVVNESGHIEIANAQAEALFGYSRAELIGQPVEKLIPQRYAGHHVQLRGDYAQEPKARPMGEGRVLYGLRKDGSEFPVSISLSPIQVDNKLRVISDIRDVTAEREAERHIRELNTQLVEQNNELERINRELEAFSYSVSHDLRAPLRAIDGFSEILSQEYADELDQRGRDYLQRVRRAAQKMGQLIDDLLNLSRIARAEIRFQDVDLSAMAADALRELEQQEPERRVEALIQEDIQVRGDSRLLRIVLDNLLANAWKFTRDKGDARILFGMERQQEETVYYIQDNGAGFDMAYADRMFGAFQRLHDASEFPGTGIGLATVQRVIHKHGGRIWARGEPGEGASFYFTLGREMA